MVEIRGLEPLASALRTPRYTNLAISPRQKVFYNIFGKIASVFFFRLAVGTADERPQSTIDNNREAELVLKMFEQNNRMFLYAAAEFSGILCLV